MERHELSDEQWEQLVQCLPLTMSIVFSPENGRFC